MTSIDPLQDNSRNSTKWNFVMSIDDSHEFLSKIKKPILKHLIERELGISHQISSASSISHEFFIHRRIIESRCPSTNEPEKVLSIQSNPTEMRLVGNKIYHRSDRYPVYFATRPQLKFGALKCENAVYNHHKDFFEFYGVLKNLSATRAIKDYRDLSIWEDNALDVGQMPTVVGLSSCGHFLDFFSFDNQKLIKEVQLHQRISYDELTTNEEHSLIVLQANRETLNKDVFADFLVFQYYPLYCLAHLQIMNSAFRPNVRFEVMGPFGMIAEGRDLSVAFLLECINHANSYDEDESLGFKITHRLTRRPPILFTIKSNLFYLDMDENAYLTMCVSLISPGHFQVWQIDNKPIPIQNGEICPIPANFVAGHKRLPSTFQEDFESDTLDFLSDGSPRMVHKTSSFIRILEIEREENENGEKTAANLTTQFVIDFNTLGPDPNLRTSGRTKNKCYNFNNTHISYSYNGGLDMFAALKVTPYEMHIVIYEPKDWTIIKEFKCLLSSLDTKTKGFLDIKDFSFNDDFLVLELLISQSKIHYIFINLLTE